MIRRKIRNVENLNEYLSQCGNEYSILGFDINTVIGAVMLKTYRQKSPRIVLSVISSNWHYKLGRAACLQLAVPRGTVLAVIVVKWH